MQQPLGPVTCKTCGSEIRIWYQDDGKAIPFYEIICPNGEDHTFALDLPGTFLYAELMSEE